jgi:actin-related protein
MISNGAQAYHSLTELKATHSRLLKSYGQFDQNEAWAPPRLPPELLAQMREFIRRGRATGAILDNLDDRWDSQGMLDYWATVLYQAGDAKDKETGRVALAEFDPELAPTLAESQCPYQGLSAFQEAKQQYFFGRDFLVQSLLELLSQQRLLAVIGPSGSGKSSLALAGLLPALKQGKLPDSQTWRYFDALIPGADPLLSLARRVKPAHEPAIAWQAQHVALFKQDPAHLRRLVEAQTSAPAVLVVDQFEELFTLANDQEAVSAFCANLLRLAEGGPHTVILTLRSEFEPHVARLGDFYAAFQQGRFQVTPLSASQLREAIEEPAKLVGLKFEVGLVEALVNEILGEPAGLPLLQFTLLELWRRREKNRVTWQAYKTLGGAREALTHVADRFYENLIPQEQEIVRRALTRLGWTDGGVEVLRNRVAREVLHKVCGTPDGTDRVLDKLVNARLLSLTKDELMAADKVSPNDQFEVAHEALIRNWRRLVRWLEEERETMRQRLRLRAQAEQWRAHDKDPGGLLGGSLLAEALRYHDLDKLEEEFVQASQAAAEAAERASQEAQQREAEARQRELTQARELAEAERHRAEEQRRAIRYLRRAALAMLALFLLATGMAAYALQQRNIAVEQSGLANGASRRAAENAQENERLATEARKVAERRAEEAKFQQMREEQLRIKAEAAQDRAVKAKQEAENLTIRLKYALNDAEQNEYLANKQAQLAKAREAEVKAALDNLAKEKQATDAALQARMSAEEQANKINNQKLRELERAALVDRAATSFSPDGNTLLTITADDRARLWDARSGQLRATLARPSSWVTSAAFEPSGKYVATAEEDGTVRLWEMPSGCAVRSFKGTDAALKLAFSPDGRRLGVAGNNGETLIYEVNSGKVFTKLATGQQPVIDLSFSYDGQSIATTNADQRTTLWKTGPGGTLACTDLSDAACRPTTIEMANLSLTSDLRLSLVVDTRCLGGAGESETHALSCEQIKVLTKDVSSAAKQLEDGVQKVAPKAAPKVVTIDLDDKSPVKTDEAPSPQINRPANPLLSKQTRASVGKGLEKQLKLVLDISQRQPQGEWVMLSHVSRDNYASTEAAAIVEQLARQGLSDKQVETLSNAAYRLGKELDASRKTNAQEYQRQALSLGQKLQREVFAVLGLLAPYDAVGGICRPARLEMSLGSDLRLDLRFETSCWMGDGAGPGKRSMMVIDAYNRRPSGEMTHLAHVAYEGSGDQAPAQIERLSRQGPSDKQVEALSYMAHRLGRILDAARGTGDEEYKRQNASVIQQLLDDVLVIMDLAPKSQ